MGELDVATIKSIFEKGNQGELTPQKGRTQERRRTIATYGLSPGALSNKKSIGTKTQKQVRIAPLLGVKKDAEKTVGETSEKISKPSTANTQKIETTMGRRMTMPTSYSAAASQVKESENASKKVQIKDVIDVNEKDISSEKKNEDVSPGIKPTFSGRRSFFDGQSSTASDPKESVVRKGKPKAQIDSGKKVQNREPNKKEPFKVENKATKKAAAEPKKVSKFAYASAIKDKRASATATMIHADRKQANDRGQSQISDPFPLRRQSLSDLPLPEHESVEVDNDVNNFHRSLSHSLQAEEQSESAVNPKKKTVTREKDMNLLKDRKTVTSMIQQFSSQPTPTHENKTKRVKKVNDISEPPIPPIQEPIQEDSNDQDDCSDSSEFIEEVTVVSEAQSSSRPADGDDDYSYEEVTATDVDEYTEMDMMSSAGLETASRVSYTPSIKSQSQIRVVVDFQNMEMPASKMKEKHLKVVKDLETLMTKTANQPETKVQRTIKDKMMHDLLNANKSMVPEGVRASLLEADLTIHEVSEIVAHMNMCAETKSPIRWDLIRDIVYPDGIIDDETNKAFEDAVKQQGGSKSNLPPISTSTMFPQKGQAATPTGTLGIAAAQELFRNQYDLSKDDMADIVAHLTLCEETGTPIRWDLIYQIVYPEDEMSGAEDSQTDPGSMMIDALDDNESVTSWYSIYPEFDECGSEITFNIEDEDEVGSLPRPKTPKEAKDGGIGGQVSPQRPGPVQRGISDNSELANQNDDQLLRKRIQQLQLATGGKGSFQVHQRKKGV